jgi:hypothetical protein
MVLFPTILERPLMWLVGLFYGLVQIEKKAREDGKRAALAAWGQTWNRSNSALL